MKLVCDILTMTTKAHAFSPERLYHLREACVVTLKTIARRYPRTALRLMEVTVEGVMEQM